MMVHKKLQYRLLFTSACLLIILGINFTSALAGVYKWTDEQGKVHYSDSPPAQKGVKEIKVQTYSGPAVVTPNKSATAGTTVATSQGKITIYSASWCGYCKRAKAYLNSRGISYSDLDVETSEEGKTAYRKLGAHGVPVIFVGEQRMDGFNQASLEDMLKTAGY